MQLKKQLSKFSDEEFKLLVEKEALKRAAKAQKKKLLPRPKEISAEEFKTLVDRTKALFLGKKFKRQEKIVLDIEITEHIAWTEDVHPSIVSIDAKVSTSDMGELWILENLNNLFTDYFAALPPEDYLKVHEVSVEMTNEIKKLLDEIRAKEQKLGLPADSIWDAIYDRCGKYSQG